MAFGHVQGGEADGNSVTTVQVVLGANPTLGNIVCIGFGTSAAVSSLVIKDSNGNTYTVTPNSPENSAGGLVYLAYLLSAPANANKTITATWTTSVFASIWADEFSVSGGTAAFDKDAKGTGSGTTVNLPSITPAGAGELLYSCMGNSGSTITAPTAGGASTNGVWTGAAGGISTNGQGGDAEYDLNASAATPVNYTQTSATWSAMAMAFIFTPVASGKNVGVVTGISLQGGPNKVGLVKVITVNGS